MLRPEGEISFPVASVCMYIEHYTGEGRQLPLRCVREARCLSEVKLVSP
jgi:hypothetical protein